MKALLIGKTARGFSTLELVIALALISLVMGGVILGSWSSGYWAVASQTSNEALYKAKTKLEDLRAQAKQDFSSIASSPEQKDMDTTCAAGGLCYYIGSSVTALSQCADYAQASVAWQVVGYPTTTTSLFTNLTNPGEILARGTDCLLTAPKGAWSSINQTTSYSIGATPSAIDTLSGTSYITTTESPFLSIVTASGVAAFTNGFALDDGANAIDVARDARSGRTYAYLAIASTSVQFQVVDVTEPEAPFLVASKALTGVAGTEPQGWRVVYYNSRAYVTTLYTVGPELNIFDVSVPENPLYLGSKDLGISVYDLVVRNEGSQGSVHTLAYFATADDDGEVTVYNVTDAAHPAEVVGARTDIPGSKDARSIYISGNRIFVGFKSGSGADLFALDASSPLSLSHGFPIQAQVDTSPRSITGVQVSGEYVFLAGVNVSPQLQIRKASDLSLVSNVSVVGFVGVDQRGLDIEGDSIYTLSSGSPQLRVFESNN